MSATIRAYLARPRAKTDPRVVKLLRELGSTSDPQREAEIMAELERLVQVVTQAKELH